MSQQEKKNPVQPRMLILFVLLAILVTSSYINYRSAQTASTSVTDTLPVVRVLSSAAPATPVPSDSLEPSGTPAAQTFADYAAQRAQTREQEIKMLDEIIAGDSSSAEIAAQAQSQKLGIVSSMEKENTLESLLHARGFAQALAYVSAASVTVVIGQEDLTETQITQILDLAIRETGEKAENIKIIARK